MLMELAEWHGVRVCRVLLEDKAGPGATLAGASAAHDAAGPATPHACTAPSAARRGNQQAPPTTQPAADNGSGIPPPAAFHVLAAAAAKEGADSTNNSVDWPGVRHACTLIDDLAKLTCC